MFASRHPFSAVALILATFFAPPQQRTSTPLRDQLQAKFEELHNGGSFPGGTAGFVLADGTTIALAVGVSDRTSATPMKPTDRLLLGSVGKTYVSAVALQLVHEKRFGLDDPISKYLGGTKAGSSTLR